MNDCKAPGFVAMSIIAGLLFTNQTWASPEGHGTQWGLGVAAGLTKKPYTGYGTDYSVLPIIFLDSQWVRIAGPAIDLKLGRMNNFSFALETKIGLGDGYKSSDAPILNGMAKRKGSIWLGPSVTWGNYLGRVTAKVLADTSDNSQGQQASLEASQQFQYKNFEFSPHLGVTWLSSDYVDYYYGVEANEARIDRAAYAGQSTVNFSAGFRTDYHITKNQTVMMDINWTRFGSGITDSSLVDTSTVPNALIGYMFRF